MSVSNIAGLPFQNEYLNAQKLTEQKKPTNVFSNNNSELTLKLQEVTQTYQQKGSIFKTEDIKTNVAEDGYMGKLVDQKWAQSNFEYEQGNYQKVKATSQALENAVNQTAANIRDYQSKIAKTNLETNELNQKIATDTKELEALSKLFAAEQKTKDAEEAAKATYLNSVNKDKSLNRELTSINGEKERLTNTIGNLKQRKSDVGSTINSLTARKAQASSRRSSLEFERGSIASDISSLRNNISSLKAQRGAAKPSRTVANTAANTTTATANTNQTAQNNNVDQAEQQVVNNQVDNQVDNTADFQLDAQIQAAEAELAAKIREQAQMASDIENQKDLETQLDGQIQDKKDEDIQLDDQIADREGQIPEFDNKIKAKQQEIDDNKKITDQREEVYKKASAAHDADAKNTKGHEAKYKNLKIDLAAMKDKRDNNDKGLKQFKKTQEYLNALLEGQGNAKAGAKTEVEIAEKKADKQYADLLNKNGIVENSRMHLFSQQDITSKAKGDLKSVSLEMEKYNNVFSTSTKI